MAKKAADVDPEVEGVLSEISKRHGEEAAMVLGKGYHVDCDAISTGSIALDKATGVGGLPRGRIVECFGPESSGKTTLALSAIANAQKTGNRAAFVDVEHALDPIYATALGVDLDALLFSQPDNGEQALDIVDIMVKSGKFAIIVIDSVSALVPKAELDGDMGDAHVGLQARLMGQAMRKLTGAAKRTNTCILFINQIRYKVGVMFGNPETTSGGNALKFYASMRLDIRRIETLKTKINKEDTPVGNRTKVTIKKNKVGPPMKVVKFDILYGKGINRAGEIIEIGLACKVLQRAGAWISYGEERLGQGRGAACDRLNMDPDLCQEIELRIEQAEQREEE